jgi:hypothetical protein
LYALPLNFIPYARPRCPHSVTKNRTPMKICLHRMKNGEQMGRLRWQIGLGSAACALKLNGQIVIINCLIKIAGPYFALRPGVVFWVECLLSILEKSVRTVRFYLSGDLRQGRRSVSIRASPRRRLTAGLVVAAELSLSPILRNKSRRQSATERDLVSRDHQRGAEILVAEDLSQPPTTYNF